MIIFLFVELDRYGVFAPLTDAIGSGEEKCQSIPLCL